MLFLKASISGKGFVIAGVSAFLCAAFLYFITGQKAEQVFWGVVVCTLIMVGTVLIAGQYIDTSYDGNGYRKIMVGLLKEGWNPIWQTPGAANNLLAVVPKDLGHFGNRSEWFCMDVYPKSAAIAGGVIYDITNNVESGKYMTLLSMVCIFCLYHCYLKRYLAKAPAFFVSLCIAMNPVSMTQIRSFYVDAFMGNIILLAVIFIMMYFEPENIRGGGEAQPAIISYRFVYRLDNQY